MDDIVRYTGRWNRLLMKPFAGYDWLDAGEARKLYEQRPGPGVIVVGGTQSQGPETFIARWVIGFGTSSGVRVQFFNEHGTLWRLVDYNGVDGRLWRWITEDYVYSDDARKWAQREALLNVKATVEPDGDGFATTIDKTDPDEPRPIRSTTPFQNAARASYWVDRPTFGDWAALADPGPSAWEVAGQPVPTQAS